MTEKLVILYTINCYLIYLIDLGRKRYHTDQALVSYLHCDRTSQTSIQNVHNFYSVISIICNYEMKHF